MELFEGEFFAIEQFTLGESHIALVDDAALVLGQHEQNYFSVLDRQLQQPILEAFVDFESEVVDEYSFVALVKKVARYAFDCLLPTLLCVMLLGNRLKQVVLLLFLKWLLGFVRCLLSNLLHLLLLLLI